ncbi:MAG: tetratricopeptide repeat protein [Deltaproteobacteria bacterium]|nr:tetratricopeptide repeat protein [Deltaproteobacteria bacterium]
MARTFSRRRDPLKEDEVLSLAQRAVGFIKLHQKWVIAGAALAAVITAAVLGVSYWQQSRRDAAAAALAEARLAMKGPEDAEKVLPVLTSIISRYGNVPAAGEAAMQRAHLLYQLKKYEEAAKSYKELLAYPAIQAEPGVQILVTESLSYCYEGSGNFAEAAQVLQPLVEKTSGPFQSELTRRLAWLYDKAGNHQEANKYWEKLLEKASSPVLVPYYKEKLADAAANPEN